MSLSVLPVLSRLRDDTRTAWSYLPVKMGFLGTLIVTVGSLTPAYLPQASPVWPVLRAIGLAGQFGRVAGTILTISGVFLLVDAWFRLRHQMYARLNPLVVVGLWCLPFVFSPPIFSHDMYSYGAQGWMLHNGLNPYDGGPSLVPGAFSDYAPWVWRYTPAPYGPLALQMAHLIVDMSGGHPWLAALLMRVPALIAVAGIVYLLPKIADRMGADRHQVIWFACLNPLLVIDYVGGGHNDAWMMGVVIVALWIATRPRWWIGAAVMIGMAASIKQPAILATVFLPLITVPLPSWRNIRATAYAIGKALASSAIAIGVFIAVSLACGLGFGWIDALKVPASVGSASPSYLIGTLVQIIVNPEGSAWLHTVMNIGLGIGAVFIVYAALRYGPREPLKALSWSWIAAALAASALHSWYLLWGGLLLPLSRKKTSVPWVPVLVVILMLCYAGINLGDRNGFFAIIAASVCMLAWLAHIVIYHRVWTMIRARHESSGEEDMSRDTPGSGDGGHPGSSSGEHTGTTAKEHV